MFQENISIIIDSVSLYRLIRGCESARF